MTITTTEFVTGLRDSNEAVFEVVFKAYYERLCNYAHSMIYDIDDAEEMVQNTFLTLWEKRGKIAIHTSVKSYLYKAVHNSCLNRIKHYKVRREHSDYYRSETPIEHNTTSNDVLGNELETQINSAIETLPSQCRTVFRLSRFENLTYAEIGEQLSISVKTVDKHMVKALKILRVQLKEYLPALLWLLIMKN